MITKKAIFIGAAILLAADLAFNFMPEKSASRKVLRNPAEENAPTVRAESTPALAPMTEPSAPSQTQDSSAPPFRSEKPVKAAPAKPNSTKPAPDFQAAAITPAEYYARSREALAMVGSDDAAEAYWIAAINDTSLTPNQRKDLIEDLNEDGFEDPKHPTLDELPLITNRLALIEDLAPDAIDDVNAEAFAEAYKDLVSMYNRLSKQ